MSRISEKSIAVMRLIASGVNTPPAIAEALGIRVRDIESTLSGLSRCGRARVVRTRTRTRSSLWACVEAEGEKKAVAGKNVAVVPVSLVSSRPHSVTAALCGDPIYERSALYARSMGQ